MRAKEDAQNGRGRGKETAIYWALASMLMTGQATASVERLPAQPRAPLVVVYPEKCARRAQPLETVIVDFDLAVNGSTENVRAVETTNQCFEKSALKAVENWQFWLTASAGASADRQDARVTLIFDRLTASTSPDRKMRGVVKRRLARVQRHLAKDKDPKEALEKLATINEKYGETFSLAEFAAFNMLCAIARFESGDHNGALEYLRNATDTGLIDPDVS